MTLHLPPCFWSCHSPPLKYAERTAVSQLPPQNRRWTGVPSVVHKFTVWKWNSRKFDATMRGHRPHLHFLWFFSDVKVCVWACVHGRWIHLNMYCVWTVCVHTVNICISPCTVWCRKWWLPKPTAFSSVGWLLFMLGNRPLATTPQSMFDTRTASVHLGKVRDVCTVGETTFLCFLFRLIFVFIYYI